MKTRLKKSLITGHSTSNPIFPLKHSSTGGAPQKGCPQLPPSPHHRPARQGRAPAKKRTTGLVQGLLFDLCEVDHTQAMLPALEAILGHRSAHSFATGPVMAEPGEEETTTERQRCLQAQRQFKAALYQSPSSAPSHPPDSKENRGPLVCATRPPLSPSTHSHRTFHFTLVIYYHSCVVFEIEEHAVFPPVRFPLPNDHCRVHCKERRAAQHCQRRQGHSPARGTPRNRLANPGRWFGVI